MIEKEDIYMTLVCLDDSELKDDAYEAYIKTVTQQLTNRLGALHGPNALKILGSSIVRCTYDINRDADSVSTVDVRCSIPDDMIAADVIGSVLAFWANIPLGSSEYYLR